MLVTLLDNGFENIFVMDNASRSEPLLDLYDEFSSDVSIILQGENLGPHRTFERILVRESRAFIFSDPDLKLASILPSDFLNTIFDVSRRYACRKVGLALEIPSPSEARDIRMKNENMPHLADVGIREWEARFWRRELEPGVYRADVDTTFHLWNTRIRFDLRRDYVAMRNRLRPGRLARHLPLPREIDIRIAKDGFIAKHLPWYHDDGLTQKERDFYRSEAGQWSTWARE